MMVQIIADGDYNLQGWVAQRSDEFTECVRLYRAKETTNDPGTLKKWARLTRKLQREAEERKKDGEDWQNNNFRAYVEVTGGRIPA
jgi:hypothetical protein